MIILLRRLRWGALCWDRWECDSASYENLNSFYVQNRLLCRALACLSESFLLGIPPVVYGKGYLQCAFSSWGYLPFPGAFSKGIPLGCRGTHILRHKRVVSHKGPLPSDPKEWLNQRPGLTRLIPLLSWLVGPDSSSLFHSPIPRWEQDGYANGVYQRVVSWIGWFEEFRR